jgi:hypothetical protein
MHDPSCRVMTTLRFMPGIYARTSRTRVISDGAPKRLGGPQ